MAKMYFRYGAMGSGKTTHLLQVVNNYERIHKTCVVCKPSIDTKADDYIISRLGVSRKVDYLIGIGSLYKDDNFLDKIFTADCILVDEAQFLTEQQVWELYEISKMYNKPVITCRGMSLSPHSCKHPSDETLSMRQGSPFLCSSPT